MQKIRKTYFVNPRLQLQLVLGANVLAFVSTAMIATLMFQMQLHLENCAAVLSLSAAAPAVAELARQEANILRMCLIVGTIQFVVFNLTAILMSHRIAGPLHRLGRHLEQVGAGEAPVDVKFRKGDLFQSLAEACNKVMARLRTVST
jgi:methyl-accepting chemotaxis protein